jgi:serine phosphatase RsbU (regulator of sigma subunit)
MVIDCTGHGVPGAFLTMLVKAIEKQIIETLLNQNTPSSPSKILHSFNLKLRETLLQQNEDVAHSGFDGAILIYNKEKKSINYSGAKIPLYFVRDGDITIFKGDRQSIGYSRTDMNFEFKEHNIEIKDGDLIYITTDGYIDQIGGEKGFPFSNKNFKNFIADNLNLPFETQKINFIETIETYRGDKIKNDDITVVGFKF